MKKIKLTNGGYALVDDEDYPALSKFKWYALHKPYTSYARRTGRLDLRWMHRVILDAKSGEEVDHRDHNGLNNRRSNIWKCSHSQNQRNKRNTITESGKVGVYRIYDRWLTQVKMNGKTKYIGTFSTIEAAVRARRKFKLKNGLL